MDADIYVLATDRKVDTAQRFLDQFLPERKFDNKQYECYPWDGKEERIVRAETEYALLKYMEEQSQYVLTIGFYPLSQQIFLRGVFLYYLLDGGMICCLNIHQDDLQEDILLDELKHFLESDFGFISYHIPPPNTTKDFMEVSMT